MKKGKILITIGVSLNIAGCIALLISKFTLQNSIVSAIAILALILIGAGSSLNKREKKL